jgi:hypothetical protein
MTTALIVLALVLGTAGLVLVVVQCVRDPFVWVLHLCLNTIGTLVELIAHLLAALAGANGGRGSAGGSS